jgi:hypothetical protein
MSSKRMEGKSFRRELILRVLDSGVFSALSRKLDLIREFVHVIGFLVSE